MSTKRFVVRMLIRFSILIVALIIISNYTNTLGAIANNELALGQMENSTEAFLFVEIYNGTIKPLITLVISLITSFVVIRTVRDTYKFIKTKEKNKNEKES